MTEQKTPLFVTADLTLQTEGVEAEIKSAGDRLFVEIGSLADGIRLARGSSGGIEERLRPVLEQTALTVEIRIRGRTVAVSGSDSRPGIVSRFSGIDPDEVRVGGILGAIGAEISAGVQAGRRLIRAVRSS
ncbi:MAG: hypothetical protein V5A36_04580 [Natronomonas sp.]